jgi:hypothetical protein
MSIRTVLREKAYLGWSLAGLLFILAAVLAFRAFRGTPSAYTFDRLTENVVIKDRETGEEWTMPRGRMEAILWDRGARLDPSVGLPNPTTGTPTGFPKSEWEATVERIKSDREAAAQAYGGHVPTSGATAARKPAPK